MAEQFNRLAHYTRWLTKAAFTSLLLLVSFQPAFGQTEITEGKEQFMSTLASMPYTSSGSGPVLYVLEFSEGSHSQAFERDWKDRLGGVEVRRLFYAVSNRTANETAYLAQTRNIDDFYAFMNGTKVAPDFKKNNSTIKAFKDVIGPLKDVLLPIMIKNGWPRRSPVSPQFMWETNGHVYVHGGYTKKSFTELLNIIRAGTQVAQTGTFPTLPSSPSHEVKQGPIQSDQPVESAPKSNFKTNVKAGEGPNILGISLGMAPSEVRAIIKSRILNPATIKLGYNKKSEGMATLSFTLPGRSEQPVPDGDFLSNIRLEWQEDVQSAQPRRQPQMTHSVISVFFTPVPKHEEVVAVQSSSYIVENKQPTKDAFEKALMKKYGAATLSGILGDDHYWIYDSNGSLLKLESVNRNAFVVSGCLATSAGSNWVLERPEAQKEQACGATLIKIKLQTAGAFIKNYDIGLYGFDNARITLKTAQTITETARSAALEAEMMRGQLQQPRF